MFSIFLFGVEIKMSPVFS